MFDGTRKTILKLPSVLLQDHPLLLTLKDLLSFWITVESSCFWFRKEFNQLQRKVWRNFEEAGFTYGHEHSIIDAFLYVVDV